MVKIEKLSADFDEKKNQILEKISQINAELKSVNSVIAAAEDDNDETVVSYEEYTAAKKREAELVADRNFHVAALSKIKPDYTPTMVLDEYNEKFPELVSEYEKSEKRFLGKQKEFLDAFFDTIKKQSDLNALYNKYLSLMPDSAFLKPESRAVFPVLKIEYKLKDHYPNIRTWDVNAYDVACYNNDPRCAAAVRVLMDKFDSFK